MYIHNPCYQALVLTSHMTVTNLTRAYRPEVKLVIVYDVMQNNKNMTCGTSSEPHELH